MKYPVLLGALAIGLWSQMALAQTYDLTLTATGPSTPPTGAGSFTIDTPPPGLLPIGLYTEGNPGNDLLDMSFTVGADTFDLTDELSFPVGTAQVQFDASGDVTGISYIGSVNGDQLIINGLDYTDLVGGNIVSAGTISATAVTSVPEPASMGLLAAGLAGLTALRRRRVR